MRSTSRNNRDTPKFKHDRPTIGILPGWSSVAGIMSDSYLASILKGVQSAARAKECHLLLAWGLERVTHNIGTFPAWPVVAPDSDFIPVGPWNTDGIIVFAPLSHEARSRYLQELSDQGFPILYIATGERGPTISVDNEGGIHQAVAHFVDHGHRHIAFLAGDPNDTGDSESRLHAYHSAMAEHGLETNPALIRHGSHTFLGGYEEMQKIIQSGVKFTALVASDDISAIGATQAIRESGLQVPHDVAIIGFDDQPDAVAQVPPLASIHVSLPAIGEQALALMFDHLVEGYELESVQIPVRLVPRQSCGCLPQIVSSAGRGWQSSQISAGHLDTESDDLETIKQRLVAKMIATLPLASRLPFEEQINRLCTELVESFYSSLKEDNPSAFQITLMKILQELELTDESIDSWQSMISILRREMSQLPVIEGQTRTQILAEDMLHQARTAISESAQRQDYRHQYQWEIMARAISELSARLSASLDERQAVEILEAHLSSVHIKHVRVALFEKDQTDTVAWSVLLNSQSEESSHHFPTREFPPVGLY